MSKAEFEHLLKVMLNNYEQQNHLSNEKILMSTDAAFWTSQLSQLLLMIPDL